MKKFIPLSSSAIIAALGMISLVSSAQSNYTVHEWGTFTDVQGGDGQLLSWRPLETSELPGFVRDWKNPGMNRRFSGFFIGNEPTVVTGVKQTMITLQRLETPVMYFYSDNDMAVDVSVKFPKGLITEWYPQATQIGPSLPLDTNASAAATLLESRAVWKQLQLFPQSKDHGQLQSRLPQDQSGASRLASYSLSPPKRGEGGGEGILVNNDRPPRHEPQAIEAPPHPALSPAGGEGENKANHYFAARETGADTVRTELADGTNGAGNYEKFIFYRGAGSFKTPLRVSVNSQNEIVLENTGDQPLSHLFLLGMKNGAGAFEEIDSLQPGASRTLPSLDNKNAEARNFCSLADGQAKLGDVMRAALVGAGLFADEAAAMVNTWKDSWFAEDGVRVLYLLPRAWTDETLPLTLNPKPEKVVRVMVGRAEIITPQTEKNLAGVLAKAEAGDEAARQQSIAELKKMGRFAEPALQLADRGKDSTNAAFDFQLLPTAASGN